MKFKKNVVLPKGTLNELACFAGSGGGLLASKLLGFNTVCGIEKNKERRKEIFARQRDGMLDRFPVWDDITTFKADAWKNKVNVISAGFPCTDISTARTNNKKEIKGLAGKASGLWFNVEPIIETLEPEICFIENSPNLKNYGLETILKFFAKLGYDVEWGVLSGGDVKAPHQRKRMWIVAANPNCSQFKRSGLPRRRNKKNPHFSLGTWWKDQPTFHRVDDGIPRQMDRLEGIGNAQIPIVATIAFTLLYTKLMLKRELFEN
jgi:DNA (cytosine-5)-methyltransferase 1